MKLFPRLFHRPGKARYDAPVEPETPFFALGDLHGCDTLLRHMLDRLDRLAHPTARLVCLGDYVDRGESSRMVLRRLHTLSRSAGDLMVCLMGNHERMLLDAMDNPARDGPRWLRHGGLQTLASYGIQPPGPNAPESAWLEMRDALRAAMGEGIEAWLRALPLSWQTGNVVAVHAGADPSRPIAEQSDNTLLWGHPDFGRVARTDGLWIVHGHSIVDDPVWHAGRISVDTGAYATGRLTAALVERQSVEFLCT
ncbi:metallophosphoesterase family protein [Ponticoccus alexandrii]|uniref:Serine/threonine protein phosphatase n=1 Tax=Ponticoccus alexandrii TaxID=1943633 RepID=A0ABX7FCF4_9RHOB|nr:metallophosphoesterase family protein [Ponticoccus alexandrii]QRF68068.1 serine/threonine protein phosphatase [Ponticoccus alexandrii]